MISYFEAFQSNSISRRYLGKKHYKEREGVVIVAVHKNILNVCFVVPFFSLFLVPKSKYVKFEKMIFGGDER